MNTQISPDGSGKKKELTNEELKEIELKILKEIKRFCEKHDLKYFLAHGTLLGAIRHNGFIPWDDDIDIYMPRDDYNKFITLFNENSDGTYKFVCMENDPEYCNLFGKVISTETVLYQTIVRSTPGMGVYVDVFPLDGLGDSLNEAKHIVSKCRKHRRQLGLAMRKGSATPIELIKNMICRVLFLRRRKIYSKHLRKSLKYPFVTSKYVGFTGTFYGEREIFDRELFRETELHKFEDELFPIPVGYDTYLKQVYGDYMTPPPVEEQVTHHSFVAYRK